MDVTLLTKLTQWFNRLKIWQKIFGSFMLLIVFLSINAIVSIVTLEDIRNRVDQNGQVTQPSLKELQKLHLLLAQSRIYFQSILGQEDVTKLSVEDFKAIREIQEVQYPALKGDLQVLAQDWQNKKLQQTFQDTLLLRVDKFMAAQGKLLLQIAEGQASFRLARLQFAKQSFGSQVLPLYYEADKQLVAVTQIMEEELSRDQISLEKASAQVRNQIIIVSVLTVVLGLAFAYLMSRSLTGPLLQLRQVIQVLSLGKLPQEYDTPEEGDEIAEMAKDVGRLIGGISQTSNFASDIGKGKYDTAFTPLSEEDILGNNLLKMRENLRIAAEEVQQRQWINEGLSKVNDLIKRAEDFTVLSDELLRVLVRYLGANQGALFVLEGEGDGQEAQMKMISCFAWGKKKHLQMYLRKGEGLAGQTWREGRVRLLTEVPEDYIRITSGLGQAPPRSLLIAPMMLNEETFGIIELASFTEFLPHQVEFIRRVGENIASTLSILQNNLRNQGLLKEAQEHTGQLAAQEEEMRQNMEELQATQEEMSRIQRENELRDALLLESVLFVELDTEQHIQRSNARFQERLGLSRQEIDGRLLEDVLPLPESVKIGFEQMKQGKLWKSQFEFTHIDGKPIQLEVFGQLAFKTDKTPEKYILVFLDHSQAYRHELELQETLARLEEQILKHRNADT